MSPRNLSTPICGKRLKPRPGISQVMTGETDLRRIEDVDGAALTYAEVKAIASGNPMVIEKASIDAEVAQLGLRYPTHRNSVSPAHSGAPLERRRASARKASSGNSADIAIRCDTRGDAFVMEIDDQTIRDRGIAGELLLRHAEWIKSARGTGSWDSSQGFRYSFHTTSCPARTSC